MRNNIAIIGAGITGIMTALSCARKGARVDLYDMGEIPNQSNLSWAHGRLWRGIHDRNELLQRLAFRSQCYWNEMIEFSDGYFGRHTKSIRMVNDELCESLEKTYHQHNIQYEINGKTALLQESIIKFDTDKKNAFIGFDAILLNAKEIYSHLCSEAINHNMISLHRNTIININQVNERGEIYIEKETKKYSKIIITTGTPLYKTASADCVKKFQVHVDVHIDDGLRNVIRPMLDMGDDNVSWCVPSPNNKVLKLSASNFAYDEKPNEIKVTHIREHLLSLLKINYSVVDTHVSIYYEKEREIRQSSPYWSFTNDNDIVTVSSCDASLFKASPALSEEISNYVIHGDK